MPTETDTDGVTYLEAVGQAMMAEMEADPDVFLIGEDVGQFGGAFKVTKGFLDKFGPRRVVDTPIAETGFTGLAAGAALVGLRPIVEFQFADFISCAFDPIINVLARHHYRTGDPMPVTMRAPFGARLRAGPTHSQSVESYFAHVPGLKIVMPGTPQDAAGLLISSIRDNNPMLYLENKYLYRRLRSDGPLQPRPDPAGPGQGRPRGPRRHADHLLGGRLAGRRDRRRAGQGRHLGRGRRHPHAGAAGRRDDRQLGARRPSRAVVLHEAATRTGLRRRDRRDVQEECFWHLDQPVVRIAAKNTPTSDQPAAGGRDDPAAGGDRARRCEKVASER